MSSILIIEEVLGKPDVVHNIIKPFFGLDWTRPKILNLYLKVLEGLAISLNF